MDFASHATEPGKLSESAHSADSTWKSELSISTGWSQEGWCDPCGCLKPHEDKLVNSLSTDERAKSYISIPIFQPWSHAMWSLISLTTF
jgi:hypothetical protein